MQKTVSTPDLIATAGSESHDDVDMKLASDIGAVGVENVDKEALAFLLRYETMCRQQEAEDLSTMAHLRPLLSRLSELCGRGGIVEPTRPNFTDNNNDMKRQFTYHEIRSAVQRLSDHPQDEFMRTDQQLLLVLKTLIGKSSNSNWDSCASTDDDTCITWAEVAQCYKVVVGGMQTLSHLVGETEARSRARDRSLSLLSLFGPPAAHLISQDCSQHSDVTALCGGQQKRRHSPQVLLENANLPEAEKSTSSGSTVLKIMGVIFVLIVAAGAAVYFPNQVATLKNRQARPSASLPAPERKVLAEVPSNPDVLDQPSLPVFSQSIDLQPPLAVEEDDDDEFAPQLFIPKEEGTAACSHEPESTVEKASRSLARLGVLAPAMVGAGIGMALAPMVWKWIVPSLMASNIFTVLAMAVAPTLVTVVWKDRRS